MDTLKNLASGPFVVSVIILALFAATVLGAGAHVSDATAHLLETGVTLVLGYWLGSSAGSASKEVRLAALSAVASVAAPAVEQAVTQAAVSAVDGIMAKVSA